MKKLIPYIGFILAAILLVLFINEKRSRNYDNAEAESIQEFLKDSVRTYKNKQGQLVSEKKALQGSKTALQTLLSKYVDSTGQLQKLVGKQRKIIAAGNITTNTEIKEIPIPYEVKVPCDFERSFSKTDPFYSINGLSEQNGITINSIKIPNILSFVQDGKTIRVTNSNPYIQTTGLDSYTLKEKPKRWGLGFYGGYGIGSNGLSPQIGVGITYDLIRF